MTTASGPVVVVGAGLAGALTALHLSPEPCLLLTTGRLTEHTSSDLAQGGIAAALDDGDSPYLHALDTIHAGAGLCDRAAVERITTAAAQTVEHLAALGARFDREADGSYALGLEGAHSRHRVAHAGGDATGRELLRAAIAAVRRTPSVTVLEHTHAVRVLAADGEVTGVVVEHDGEQAVIPTGRVVLATGGIGGLFRHTTNPTGSRGQGLALAARAGAQLRDVEMVQFHPTALDVGLDPMPLVSEAVRGEGAHLVTAEGERLLDDDLAPRDVVSRAVFAELQRGGRVFLDARESLGEHFADHFPTVTAACRAAGVDPAREPIPVRPAAHYHMGGVATDDRGRTTVPGLWAVGEVASTGLHGANRLASNSLLEAAVCARWVAEDLAGTGSVDSPAGPGPGSPAVATTAAVPDQAAAPTPVSPTRLAALRTLMSDAVGVLRDGERLSSAVTTLRDRVEAVGVDAVDDTTLTALLVATSALRREESRGAHTRTDFPDTVSPAHQTLTLGDALAAVAERSTS